MQIKLSDPVEKLFMVGPTYAKRLEKLGIFTIEDLLYYFPFRYDDFSLISPIGHLQPGETVTITGKVESIVNEFTKNGRKVQKAQISDNTGKIEAIWFNQPFLTKTIRAGESYNFSGKCEWFGREKVLLSPEYECIKHQVSSIKGKNEINNVHTGRLVPVYPETSGISSKWLRSRIKIALEIFSNQIEEFLPDEMIKKENLVSEKEAIFQIHFPDNQTWAQKAKDRLSFDELFLIQLSSKIRKSLWQKKTLTKKLSVKKKDVDKVVDSLPFKLTKAQERCLNEILNDIGKDIPMNRLLEGDVGSGKTVVATIAAYAAYLNGSSTLFMAPTEILANQHFSTLQSLLSPLGITIELITGSRKPKVQSAKCKVQNCGKNIPKIIIGTHALLYQDFTTNEIGLVIVDEQHRFGVEQRALLAQKGKSPHFLTMTATPIPRSVALTVFSDLDLSIIDEMPVSRIPVKTWVVPKEKRGAGYDWIKTRIKDTPEQAFIICPLIEESESLKDVKAVSIEYEKLAKNIFPDLKIGLLHGKIKSKEKEKILNDFKEGRLDILVSTPVVEVGIDIPNATIMVIEGADRFGLAQLHQLRGRVGRRNLQSYCFLFSEKQDDKSLKRLKYLETTNSGLKLAEADLSLRGPGDIYGIKQHGFFKLKIASLSDINLIQKTQKAVDQILEINSVLKSRLEKYKMTPVSN